MSYRYRDYGEWKRKIDAEVHGHAYVPRPGPPPPPVSTAPSELESRPGSGAHTATGPKPDPQAAPNAGKLWMSKSGNLASGSHGRGRLRDVLRRVFKLEKGHAERPPPGTSENLKHEASPAVSVSAVRGVEAEPITTTAVTAQPAVERSSALTSSHAATNEDRARKTSAAPAVATANDDDEEALLAQIPAWVTNPSAWPGSSPVAPAAAFVVRPPIVTAQPAEAMQRPLYDSPRRTETSHFSAAAYYAAHGFGAATGSEDRGKQCGRCLGYFHDGSQSTEVCRCAESRSSFEDHSLRFARPG